MGLYYIPIMKKVKTLVFDINPKRPQKSAINRAASIIRSAGLVAFPTETVYGLGADGLKSHAVKRIYEAKKRPADNPLILHVSSCQQAGEIASELPFAAKRLMKRFWPGPLTLILEKSDIVPSNVTCGLDTVALRMPKNAIALKLIEASGAPLAAPSANLSQSPSPTMAEHVLEDLDGRIEAVIDGGRTDFGIESTILDLCSDPPSILRPGSISLLRIKKEIGPVSQNTVCEPDAAPRSPGTKHLHYRPGAKVIWVDTRYHKKRIESLINPGNTAVLCTRKNTYRGAKSLYIGSRPETVAKNLYAAFRRMDALGKGLIIIEPFGKSPEWSAVRNRLSKAASRIISQ